MKPSSPAEAQAFDVLIVGSGLAGLSAALQLAPRHRVAVLTKESLGDGASAQAQGGIAAALAADDSFDAHLQDTLVAGAGLSDPEAVRFIVERAPRCISWLESLGVPFTRDGAALHLTREGGHSARRIVHATDATGAAVQQVLLERMRMTPGIQVFEHHLLVDLLTMPGKDGQVRCLGVQALDIATGAKRHFQALHTVLATGGAGQVYQHTTNPRAATGDGIAAAARAGCRNTNMEFVQFHPTSLHHPEADSFLISEAVRGEGGLLRLPAQAGGGRFMLAHDARGELAPRDIVARAIDLEMKRHGLDCVELDISHLPPERIFAHFPNIHARCLGLGLDITRAPIPVVPAAHYTCGGIHTDLRGRTQVAGLYAIGETACTGLHGANRLASNSLLECIVLAHAAAQDIAQSAPARAPGLAAAAPVCSDLHGACGVVDWAALRRTLQAIMWDDVGIVRTTAGLARAAQRLAVLHRAWGQLEVDSPASRESVELCNLVQVAGLIVSAARSRRESRGGHFNSDYASDMLAA